MKVCRNQNGVALLTVLLATALIAVLAVGMTTEQQIGVRRTENLIEGDQAMLLARGIEEWGVWVLLRDRESSELDHLDEDWAMGLLPTPIGNGMVSGSIEDLQGRINVNNLWSKNPQNVVQVTKERLARLYGLCEMDMALVDALVDWLDENSDPLPDGAEDATYLLRDIPYRAGNRKMTSITEVLLVEGVTPENFQCLKPNISALPVATGINVNTVGPMVLASLGDGLSPAEAEMVLKDRPKDGYKVLNDLLSHPRMINVVVNPDGLQLKSDHFQVRGQSVYGNSEVSLYSGIKRDESQVKVYSHSIGAY